MPNYHHTTEAVDAIAQRLCEVRIAHAPKLWLPWERLTEPARASYRAQARVILDRERILTDALNWIERNGYSGARAMAEKALRDLAAYDAPPEPTLLEAAKALVAGPDPAWQVHEARWNALKAAVEREERAK